jgi:hypothetical protein
MVRAIEGMFGGRVSEVTMRSGNTVQIIKDTKVGTPLVAFRDALVNGTDLYAIAGRLHDLVNAGAFTVKEAKIVNNILDVVEGMSQQGVVFTAGRADLSAGQEWARALRVQAKTAK